MSQTDDFIAALQAELGKPYVFGDEGPDTFDCSGLVQWALSRVGVKDVPRIAAAQQDWAIPVKTPRVGDLVFFGDPAHHVGVYIGGNRMIDAPHTGAVVRVDNLEGRTVTGYGRVPGLGSGLVTAASALGATAGGLLTGARHVVIEVIAGAAALALVVAGLWVFNRRKET